MQGWTLNFESTRHSGEWPPKCTRPHQFSLAKNFTPTPPPTASPSQPSLILTMKLTPFCSYCSHRWIYWSLEHYVHATKVCLSSTGHSQTIPFSSSYFNHVCGPCLLVLPRITGSFRGFFVLFLSTTLETDRKYISTSWLRKVYPPIFKLTGRTPIDLSAGKVRENKSLATSLNTWQTKDYYFNG